MSKDTETQRQATNSYTSITRSSAGPSKTACAKCDARNLPICICSKGGSEENEFEEKSSDSTEKTKDIYSAQQASHFAAPSFRAAEELNKAEPILLLSGSQDEIQQFALKPSVKLIEIKALLEQFILELARNDGVDVTVDDLSIKELGENLGIYYDDAQKSTLAITVKHPEHFVEFFSRLRGQELIVIQQDQAQKKEDITHEEDGQRFSPSPFKTSLTRY